MWTVPDYRPVELAEVAAIERTHYDDNDALLAGLWPRLLTDGVTSPSVAVWSPGEKPAVARIMPEEGPVAGAGGEVADCGAELLVDGSSEGDDVERGVPTQPPGRGNSAGPRRLSRRAAATRPGRGNSAGPWRNMPPSASWT